MNNNLNIHSLIHRMRYIDLAIKAEDVIGSNKYLWYQTVNGFDFLGYFKHNSLQASLLRSTTLKKHIKEGSVPGVFTLAREFDADQHWALRMGHKTHYFVFHYLYKTGTGEVTSERSFSVPLYNAYPNQNEQTIKNYESLPSKTLAKIYKRVTGEK